MMSTFAPRLMVGAVSLALVVGCQQSPDQSTAEQTLCDSLATFGDSVTAIADLSPDTASLDDLNTARDVAQEAWDQVKTDAANVSQADDAALETAWNGLTDAITGLPADVVMADAMATIQSAVDDVQTAFVEMHDGLNCP